MRAAVPVGGALIMAAALAGCSQTAALAPVGGNRLAEIRFATNDVLTNAKIAILTAPVCTSSGKGELDITCTGSTTANEVITSTSKSADQKTLDVTVGTRSIYHGAFMDVLNSAARPTS